MILVGLARHYNLFFIVHTAILYSEKNDMDTNLNLESIKAYYREMKPKIAVIITKLAIARAI